MTRTTPPTPEIPTIARRARRGGAILLGGAIVASVAGGAALATAGSRIGQREKAGPPLAAPLTPYPNREALASVAPLHLKDPGRGPNGRLAIVSWSLTGTRSWQYLSVAPDGRASSIREIWNWARQGGSYGNVANPDPKRLQAILTQLGPSVAPPPLERVLIVSFRDRGRWTTRVYDRDRAPAALIAFDRALYGERRDVEHRAPWIDRVESTRK